MSDDEKQKTLFFLPTINPKSAWTSQSYIKSVQEAPYRALVGAPTDGRIPEMHPVLRRYRVRCQTGLTNRWRLPQPLYSDMLGSAQALKAINVPFEQGLVSSFKNTYPTMNPMLFTCQDFADITERNWSLMKKQKLQKISTEEDEENVS